jgi:hypothetical protein
MNTAYWGPEIRSEYLNRPSTPTWTLIPTWNR